MMAGDDPQLEAQKGDGNKPIKRRAHDIFWLILFVLVQIGMIIIIIFTSKYGSIDRLRYGRDSLGNFCGTAIGRDSRIDLTASRYLYRFDFLNTSSYKRCIETCPSSITTICKYGVNPEDPSNVVQLAAQISSGDCTGAIPTKAIGFTCIPEELYNAISSLGTSNGTDSNVKNWATAFSSDLNSRALPQTIFQDLYPFWWIILASLGISLALSIIWLLSLRITASFFVWTTVGLLLIVSNALAAFLIYNYVQMKIFNQELYKTGFQRIDNSLMNEHLLLALCILAVFVVIVVVTLVCCSFRSLKIGIALLNETTKVFKAIPLMVFYPIIKYFVILGASALFLYTVALLSTSGELIAPELNSAAANQSALLSNRTDIQSLYFEPSVTYNYLIIYTVFWYLWFTGFIAASTHCVIAGAVGSWYWTRDKQSLPKNPILRSLGRLLYYHLGSIAIGSLLIALFQMLRIVLTYLHNKAKTSNNKLTQYILACVLCCATLIQKILSLINKNAYIEIAIYGYSFCQGAKAATNTLSHNALKFVAISWISGFLSLSGKILISSLTCIAAIGMLNRFVALETINSSFSVLIVVIFIMSYFVADLFMTVFESNVSTIFLCFCEDLERNNSTTSPYFMSDNLKKLIPRRSDALVGEKSKEKPDSGF